MSQQRKKKKNFRRRDKETKNILRIYKIRTPKCKVRLGELEKKTIGHSTQCTNTPSFPPKHRLVVYIYIYIFFFLLSAQTEPSRITWEATDHVTPRFGPITTLLATSRENSKTPCGVSAPKLKDTQGDY